ncbi:MAG: hypothetical protein RR052_02505 [Oscillospiraceae bacterium]
MKKILASVLCLTISVLTFVGCGSSTKPIITIDGETLPNGLYLFYQIQSLSEAQRKATDTSKPALEQKIDNVDAPKWINNRTIEMCQAHVYVERSSEKENLALTEDEKKAVTDEATTTWERYGAAYEKNGISKDSYTTAKINEKKSAKLFDKLYADMGKEITTEEIQAYLDETSVRIDYVILPYSDVNSTILKDDIVAKNKAAAQKMLADLNDGKEFKTLLNDIPAMYLEAGVAEADIKKPEEYLTNEMVAITTKTDFVKKVLDTKLDEYNIFEDEYRAIVFRRAENILNPDDTEYYRFAIPMFRKETEYNSVLLKEAKKLAYTIDENAAKAVGPEKITQVSAAQ